MSETLTKSKFEELSEILLNIFPDMNYVIVSNAVYNRFGVLEKIHPYIALREKIGDIVNCSENDLSATYESDWRHFTAIEKSRFYLQSFGLKTRSKTMCYKRSRTTDFWKAETQNIILKFFPLMKFLNLKQLDFYHFHNAFILRNQFDQAFDYYFNDSGIITENNGSDPITFKTEDMECFVKLLYKQEL